MSPPKRMRVGVLVSGSGTNLQALMEAARAADFPAEIALVVSNVQGAGALACEPAASNEEIREPILTHTEQHNDLASSKGAMLPA